MLESRNKILTVDDSGVIRRICAETIVKLGYQALEAGDGLEALRVLEGEADKIACVLLDMNMPNMNGYETLRHIKGNPKMADIPVSMITSEIELEKVISAIQAGAKHYLKKPFTRRELSDLILATLGQHSIKRAHKALPFGAGLTGPFVVATQHLFTVMADIRLSTDEGDPDPTREFLTGIVNLKGAALGQVGLSLEDKVARRLISSMLNKPTTELSEKLLHDGILEAVNVIATNAKSQLPGKDYEYHPEAASVYTGRLDQLAFYREEKLHTQKFASRDGEAWLNMWLIPQGGF